MERFLLVGGGPKGLDAKLMVDWGFDIVCIDLPENVQKYHDNLSKATALYEVNDPNNYSEIVDLAKNAHAKHPFTNAVSFTEWGLLPVAHIVDAFGFQGNGVSGVENTVNKLKMRTRLDEKGLSEIKFSEVKSIQEFELFCVETDYRCVIKYIFGSGKQGVFIIREVADFNKFKSEINDSLNNYGSMLAEAFVSGTEYSVETFSWNGELKFITTTKKYNSPPFNVEIGHSMPVNLSGGQKKSIQDCVAIGLHELGIGYGVCHTEVIVGERGIHFVETHTRPGGDNIYDLLLYAHDVDVIKTACFYASGNHKSIVKKEGWSAGIRFFTPSEGRYSRIEGVDIVKKNPLVKDYSLKLPDDGCLKEVRGNHMMHSYIIMSDKCNIDELDEKLDIAIGQVSFVPVSVNKL